METNSNVLYMGFIESEQMKLNHQITSLLRSSDLSPHVDNTISENEFYKLIASQQLTVKTVLPIEKVPYILEEGLECILFTTMNDKEYGNIYVNVEIQGEEILRILKRESVYGKDRQMFQSPISKSIDRNLGFTKNVKKLLKYFGSKYEYHYPHIIYDNIKGFINIDTKLDAMKENAYRDRLKQYSYGRCSIDEVVKISENPFIHIVRASNEIDHTYNPADDLLYKAKRLLKIDKDSRYMRSSKRTWSFEYIEEVI